uniref:Uncharacterized protein n=1 Tax=Helianthus annuus TaxID=4232 RepID=A0A251RNB6_HELAN
MPNLTQTMVEVIIPLDEARRKFIADIGQVSVIQESSTAIRIKYEVILHNRDMCIVFDDT